ncbi:MAG: hypothetical protein NT146_17325 [Mycobacterium sp.]|nr:hypothetical protein [Mycobacterium sp.]
MATREMTKTDSRLAARCAAIASLWAAVIHFAVTPMHWRDWLPLGACFAALAVFQLLWAFVAWSRPGTLVLAAGIAANAGAAALWVTSCVAGLPVGPSAGQPEAASAAGICVLLLQCYVVMGAVWAWTRQHQPEAVSGFKRAAVLIGANAVMAGAVAIGLVGSLHGQQHHHGGTVEAQSDHPASHDAHMVEPLAPLVNGVTKPPVAPAPEQGLPVTDMGLDIGGDQHHSQPLAPAPDSDLEADGHQHHHDD